MTTDLCRPEKEWDGAAQLHSLRRFVDAEPGVKTPVARAQQRRRLVVLNGGFDFHVAADVEEAERWAGQLDQPERVVLDADEESLRPGLVPCVNVVDSPHPPGWDANRLQTGKDLSHSE